MKKNKQPENRPETKAAAQAIPAAPTPWWRVWWVWLAAFAALFGIFEIYGPAIDGAFVFDDRSLPFLGPNVNGTFRTFVGNLRPLLMFSYWVDYHRSTLTDAGALPPQAFHVTNVLLHYITSLFAMLIALRLLEWAGVERRMRIALGVFAGALFLLHPLQTESVAYVASRSEVLSVMFYYAALAVFVWRPGERMTILRAISIVVLFGIAAGTKEHTLTLPVLLLLTDYFWKRGGLRQNAVLYGILAAGAIGGGVYVAGILRNNPSAGLKVAGMTPLNYFFTEGRVIWIYVRFFFLPFNQNIDPDIAIAHGFDAMGLLGWIAIAATTVAAWMYRARAPLAAFGWFVFLLLLAPTSTVIPIKDVLAEHRLYLPFIGLALILCELLRRVTLQQAVGISVCVLAFCTALTYKRSEVWSSSLALWQDAAEKSPEKQRPRFQVAFAKFDQHRCPEAVKDYEAAAKLGPVDDTLLTDWGVALGCADRPDDAIKKFKEAAKINNTAHIHTQMAAMYGQRQKYEDARRELIEARDLDPNYDMIYAYLGSVEQAEGHRDEARIAYQYALHLNPQNQLAIQGLQRLSH